MKKILFIVSTLKRSGPTSQLFNIIKCLDRNLFEPYVVTLSNEPSDSAWEDYIGLDVRLHSLGLSRIAGVFLSLGKLRDICSAINPDIVHSQGIRSDILSSLLNINVPKLATIRNFPQRDYAMTYGRLQSKIMVCLHVFSMRKLNLCVGVSKSVVDNLNVVLNVENTACIYNGVDNAVYFPIDNDEKKILRSKLDLNLGSEIWISSGHLSERKDPLFILAFWEKNFKGDESKQLYFIGDGPMKKECDSLVKDISNVHFLGRVTDVEKYLKASDFYISSSKAEGLPNSVLEAMASGLPVLLSDIDPHSEIWELEPLVGSLFELGNMNSLQIAFNNLLQEDRLVMSKAAKQVIDEKLSAYVMSRNYQMTYLQLTDGVGQ